jgi:O-antigen ligase
LSGTFVNSNSFAAYAGMALVVALGLTFGRGPEPLEKTAVAARATAPVWFAGARIVYLALALFLFGGLLLSASRAGFGATLLGALLLAGVSLRRHSSSHPAMRWVLGATLLVAAGATLIAGSVFFHRLEGFSDDDAFTRFRLWQLALSAIRQSPWLGWGLGSYPDLYSLFQPPDLRLPNDHAHSTPLEWMLDLGIPAALCAFATVVVPLAICLRGSVRRRTDRYIPAVAFAASMVALLHSLVDFSLQIPAIGIMVSALLGMGWAHAFRRYE